MDQFFIAILPPENIREEVRSLKEEIKEKYHSKRALRLPAHITLQPPFKLREEQIPHFLKVLGEFAGTERSFKVELSGFGAFPPRVIFIEISNPTPVIHLHNALHEVMLQTLGEEPELGNREFHPHITLATKDLQRKQFEEAYLDFQKRNFSASFIASSLILFRHNGKNWNTFKELPFEG